ncbi:hypothetical protein [Pyxidicoccus xibeiensis]|uniref:hypothetical protein n=1 Tax=Pyxidicoccus xibeiensis TaxID=2906759 RepID=UPI0020A6F9A6|nr:hypothetical protein [Pyxidicoccus xibeiensis]MCP3137160.1 hypothetical protein [Pyxidicoccus xibeiensis]
MRTVEHPPRALYLFLLAGMLGAGCASGPPYASKSLAVDCRPGDSSVVCCIKKYPATAAQSCAATATEVAEVLNGLRVLNEVADAADEELDEESIDDFINNADLPEWKQECIRLYVNCKNEGWTGSCYDCIRYCEGQHDWPFRTCSPRKKRE